MQAPLAREEDLLPDLRTAVPGPASRRLATRLAAVESRNVTCLAPVPPIFWARASGSNVWDVDGNRYVDLTGAFGVASTGHAHPEVAAAICEQAATLLHGMGDVHPAEVKVALLEALTARFPGGGPARGVLGCSGADAVETALKTALLATGRPGLVAFEGGYHGLSIGALDATWRADFRDPFAARLAGATAFARYGDVDDVARAAKRLEADGHPVGAVIVEPVQGRGGEIVPPPGFLGALRARCDAEGWLLVVDEIYTGCGRTGRFFACEHEGVVPDLLCAGKGLSAGMPLSACLGRAEIMDAWPASHGEALHTQTFLGHPASCAAALAALRVIDRDGLVARAARLGAHALERLAGHLAGVDAVVEVRGRGLMLGVACARADTALAVTQRALERGVIVLPSGDGGRVVSMTPPLSIPEPLLDHGLDVVVETLREAPGGAP
jgi:4-aminobutyrate aminotransferase-like enzyme